MRQLTWAEAQDSREWDEFVARNGGSIFHTWSWRKALQSAYSRPLYLVCNDGKGSLLAVCPFFYRRGCRRLLYLDCLPNSQVAGPVVGLQVPNVREIMKSLRSAVKFSVFNPVVSMKIRVQDSPVIQTLIDLGFRHEQARGQFILDLHDKSPQDIWDGLFKKHDRQAVKYYEGRGSSFGFARNEQDYADFLALHEESVARTKDRPLNSPELLSSMRANLGKRLEIALVRLEDAVMAGFSMTCDSYLSTVYLSTLGYSRVKNIHSPIIYVNWKALNWASENGFRYVNFGTTVADPANPIYKMKQRFGGRFVPVYQFTLPISGLPYSLASSFNRAIRRVKKSTVPTARG